MALGRIGPAAADAVPALADALKDQAADVRWSAAAAAWGGIGPAAVPVLADALKDQDADVRRSTTAALGEIGPAAVPALAIAHGRTRPCTFGSPPPRRCGRSEPAGPCPSSPTRWRAPGRGCSVVRRQGVGKIGPAAVPVLADALKNPQAADVRWSAAAAWWGIGPAAAATVPALADVLKEPPDAGVRRSAAEALRAIGPAAADAVPALAERAEGPGRGRSAVHRRGAGRDRAGRRGRPRQNALKRTRTRTFGGPPPRRWGRSGPAAAATVPALIDALKDPGRGRSGASRRGAGENQAAHGRRSVNASVMWGRPRQ